MKGSGRLMKRKEVGLRLGRIRLFIRGSLCMAIGIIMGFMLMPSIISILGNGG